MRISDWSSDVCSSDLSARKILFLQMRRITRHLKNNRVHIRQERQIFQLKARDRQVTANFMQRPQCGKNPLDESVHLLGCRYARVGGVAFLFWRRTREQPFPLTRNAKLRVL